MEKRNGFNVGDKVVIDWSNPINNGLKEESATYGGLNDVIFTITNATSTSVCLNYNLYNTEGWSDGWYSERFKLAKNRIIKDIIDDLL